MLAIAGDDYAIIAADMRLCRDYSILSRNTSRLFQLTGKSVLGTGGCHTDVTTLHRTIEIRCGMYEHNHGSEMEVGSIAQMLSNTLYYRRFMPYYAFNILAGLDENGVGAVYGYDAIGNFQRQPDGIEANGSGVKLIMPLLDNLVGFKNRTDERKKYTADEAVELVKEGFVTAGERDINCGDAVEICVITKDGIRKEIFELKKD